MARQMNSGRLKLVETGELTSITWSTDAAGRKYVDIQLNIDVDPSRHIARLCSEGGWVVGYCSYGVYWYFDAAANKLRIFAGSTPDADGQIDYQILEVPRLWIVEQGIAAVDYGNGVAVDTEIQLDHATNENSYPEIYIQANYAICNPYHCTTPTNGVPERYALRKHTSDPTKLIASCRGVNDSGTWNYAPYCVVTPK